MSGNNLVNATCVLWKRFTRRCLTGMADWRFKGPSLMRSIALGQSGTAAARATFRKHSINVAAYKEVPPKSTELTTRY